LELAIEEQFPLHLTLITHPRQWAQV